MHHFGENRTTGHFVTDVFNGDNCTRFSDAASTTTASLQEYNTAHPDASCTAYVLFYERVEG